MWLPVCCLVHLSFRLLMLLLPKISSLHLIFLLLTCSLLVLMMCLNGNVMLVSLILMLLIPLITLIYLVMFSKIKLRRRLAKLGTSVCISYLLYVNNENPISFENQCDCFDYLKRFRSENVIFKLEIYRIETYSL